VRELKIHRATIGSGGWKELKSIKGKINII
jgi:hypothetical protein